MFEKLDPARRINLFESKDDKGLLSEDNILPS
jgi:hypothetical protein